MDKTLSQIIRACWQEEIPNHTDKFSTRDLAKDIANKLRQDQEFISRFVDEYLENAVVEVGRKMMRDDKRNFREMGGEIKPVSVWKKEIAAELSTERVKGWTFWKWIQFEPESGMKIALPAMTKEQLINASSYHDQQSSSNAFKAAFLRLIADMLSDGQKVDDVLDDRALFELHKQVESETNIKDDTIDREAA